MNKLITIVWIALLTASGFASSRIPDREQDLRAWYSGFNHTYFQDELPPAVITENLADDTKMAETFYEAGSYRVAINPKYNLSTKTERINLLHESCHILIFVEHDEEFDDHGPHWQACMHHLADQNAFDNLW